MIRMLWTLLLFAGFGLALLLFLRWYEPRMIYLPMREIDRTPAELGLAYEDLTLTASDGERLNAWFLPSQVPAPVTVLFLHGNAGNISHRFDKLAVLRTLGADVLIVDYRGYGRSSGRPDEGGTYRDADAAYAHLTGVRAVDPRRVVLYGESLGSAVAVDLAARKPVGGLIMESAFTSAVDVARELFPFLPAGWLVRNRYDSVAKIVAVAAPVLLLHSRDDEFFGWHHPQRLYQAASEPKRLVELRGGHNDAFLVSSGAFAGALKEFFALVASDRLHAAAP
jgi:fermentation-respiration switch protein FrsA (DUF1100 family)